MIKVLNASMIEDEMIMDLDRAVDLLKQDIDPKEKANKLVDILRVLNCKAQMLANTYNGERPPKNDALP